MQRSTLISTPVIVTVLALQLIPLVLFPASSFSPSTQEWWLPVLLAAMVLIADFQIIFRRSADPRPWYLLSFAQGFNIISRLMMLWPHATITTAQGVSPNWAYLIMSIAAMLLSAWLLWYMEKPAVRVALLH